MKAELPLDEIMRIKALHDLAILDTPRDQNFDDVAQVAMQVCDVPIAVVSLVDINRQWFKSCLGLDATETPRDVAFCAHAILIPDEVLVVEDATKDYRFADNALVTGAPYICFYAGAPLVDENGYALGTLCVIDTKPRTLSQSQRDALKALARQVIQLLRLKSMHDAMHQHSTRLQSIADKVPILIGELNRQQHYTFANKKHQDWLAVNAQDLLGKSPYEIFPAEIHSAMKSAIANSFEGKNSNLEVLLNTGRTLDVSYIPHIEAGEVGSVYEVASDITERKIHLQIMQQERERLQSIIEGTNIGTWEWNIPNNSLTINERWANMLGYTSAELQPITKEVWIALLHPNDAEHVLDLLQKHLLGITPFYDAQFRMYKKNGDWLWVHAHGRIVSRNAAGNPVVVSGMHTDISAQKRIEQMKNEFISTVSHELRTPLTSITGALGLITNNMLGVLPEKAKSMLDIAYKNSQRLTLLINDLLDMEKLLAGKMHFEMKLQILLPLVEQAIAENQSYADKYSVKYRINDAAQGAVVNIDGFRLQQVLNNFLSNGAKYSPTGGVVDINIEKFKNKIKISVVDGGTGIPEEFKVRIFQKFSQADSSDSRQKGGTGLGLAISKELVERMGGEIGFETSPAGGTCFYAEFIAATF